MGKTSKWTVIVLAIVFLLFSLYCWINPVKEYSYAERRKLAQMPEVSIETITDGSFMRDFEKYALDQFPFRDNFRSLKAWVMGNIFHKKDNHEIYVADGYAVKMEYPLNEKSLTNAVSKFGRIYDKYLKDHSDQIYLCVVPDKNYFMAKESGHLFMDYVYFYETMEEGMPYAQPIEIIDLLGIEDYYRTDIHWRQECLVDIADEMAGAMGITIPDAYEEKNLEKDFYGVYFGQSALNLPGEKLSYLTNETLEQCTVYNYENDRTTGIYDLDKVTGSDPYEIFLSGSVSLLKIENPNAATEKELIVFRDSFGSSLVPLLAQGYKSVTLIDIRYIQSSVLGNYVDFQGKDVLFLYSTAVLNHSDTLK